MLIFEKIGKDTSWKQRIVGKWKEILVFLALLMILLTLSICKDRRVEYYPDVVQQMCYKRDGILLFLGLGILATVGMKMIVGRMQKKHIKKRA